MIFKKTDDLAIIDVNNNEITYNQLIKRIKYFSDNFNNVKEKSKVILIMENRPEWVYSFYGIWDNFATAIVLDADSLSKDVGYVIKDCEPTHIVCSNKTIINIDRSAMGNIKIINIDDIVLNFDDAEKRYDICDIELNHLDGLDPVLILYTSGTTGNPKGVMLSYENMMTEADGLIKKDLIKKGDQAIVLLPFHHILPLEALIFTVFKIEASLVFTPKVASKEILETLDKNRVTLLLGVPRIYKLFYNGIKAQIDEKMITRVIYKIMTKIKIMSLRKKIFSKVHKKFGNHIKTMISGGAKLDIEIGQFFETLGFYVLEGYGLTETSPVLAVNSIKERKLGTVGKELQDTELKVIDGELYARGPQVMLGYYGKEEETKKVLSTDGWFRTGDLAEIDKKGFVTILGRKNSMIILSNGKNIDPEKIENEIIKSGKNLIKEIAVFPQNDKLVGIVVPDLAEFKKQKINNVITYIKDILEDYNATVEAYKKILDYKLYEDDLPKTKIGKLRRFLLPEIYEKKVEKKKIENEPKTKEYTMLKEYIKTTKDTEASPEDNLELELGLDSLDKAELLAYIENTFAIKLDEDRLMELENLKALSEYIEKKSNGHISNNAVEWKDIIKSVDKKEKRLSIGMLFIKKIIYLVFKLYFRLSIKGKEKLQEKQQIFISNHQSFLDPLALSFLFNKKIQINTCYLALDRNFKSKLMMWIAKNSNVILVDLNKNIIETIKEIAAYTKSGKNVLIFPEGGRTRDGEVKEFKKTFAILAKELDIDIQCLGITGAFEAYSRRMKFPKPKKIEVSVLENFHPNGTYEEITLKAENLIKQHVYSD